MVESIHIVGEIGHFSINGEIGSYEDEMGNIVKNVDLMDVVSAVKELRSQGALSFEIIVNGPGGFCDVGFDIYDFLTTIPEQVTTIAQEQCASIDTVIWFGGSIRKANCPLMIHNPWLSNVKGDADALQQATDEIKAEEDKIISFYAKHTNLEKIALDALMKNESYIYPDMAYKLGFSTVPPEEKIITPVAYKAVAKLTDNMSKETKALYSKMDSFLDKVNEIVTGKKPKAKGLSVVEQGGKTLQITNADGSDIEGAPMAGNMVTIDGAPAADGDYVLTDMGMTITVMAGVITAANQSVVDATKELETALQLIEQLKKENAESKASLEESKKDVEELGKKFTEIESTLSVMKGKTELPQARTQFRNLEESEKTIDEIKKEKEERKAKYEKV